jgi:hypothetical protein
MIRKVSYELHDVKFVISATDAYFYLCRYNKRVIRDTYFSPYVSHLPFTELFNQCSIKIDCSII